jgi:hypothetical protein
LTVLLPDRGAVAVRLQISFAPPAGPARACTRSHRPATVLRI